MDKPKTILIIEDDLMSAQYLKELLEDENYKVLDIITRGEKAVIKTALLNPDLILMDIMLKDKMSGIEAAKEIREKQKECKIVFLTAYAKKEINQLVESNQADAYLLKPYQDKEILEVLGELFSKSTTIH